MRAAGDEQHGARRVEIEVLRRLGTGGDAVEREDLAAQRHAHEPRPAQGRAGEGDADAAAEAVREPVGDARAGVRLVGDQGDALEPGREVGRGRGVPAESDDHLHPAIADDRARAPHRLPEPRGEPQGGRVRTTGEGDARDGEQLVAALRHEPRLEPLRRTQHEQGGVGLLLPPVVGEREQRIDVAGGPSAGQERGRHATDPRTGATASAVGALMRAIESTTPSAMRFATMAEPPAEMRGRGTPRTGSMPSTTAMLTKA